MSQNICVMCKCIYDTKDITIEQKIVVDEAFCPICWHKEITAFSDGDLDFSFLEGILKWSDLKANQENIRAKIQPLGTIDKC